MRIRWLAVFFAAFVASAWPADVLAQDEGFPVVDPWGFNLRKDRSGNLLDASVFGGTIDSRRGESSWWTGTYAAFWPLMFRAPHDSPPPVRFGVWGIFEHSHTDGEYKSGSSRIDFERDSWNFGGGLAAKTFFGENYFEAKIGDKFRREYRVERSDNTDEEPDKQHELMFEGSWWNTSIRGLVPDKKGSAFRAFPSFGVVAWISWKDVHEILWGRVGLWVTLAESNGETMRITEWEFLRKANLLRHAPWWTVRVGVDHEFFGGRTYTHWHQQTLGLLQLHSPKTGLTLTGGLGGGDSGLVWRAEANWVFLEF